MLYEVITNDFPEAYRDIIRKLQRAILDEGIQNTMDVEDEIIAELDRITSYNVCYTKLLRA